MAERLELLAETVVAQATTLQRSIVRFAAHLMALDVTPLKASITSVTEPAFVVQVQPTDFTTCWAVLQGDRRVAYLDAHLVRETTTAELGGARVTVVAYHESSRTLRETWGRLVETARQQACTQPVHGSPA